MGPVGPAPVPLYRCPGHSMARERMGGRGTRICGYEVLLVSQFTLYGRLQKAKPDFTKAMSTAPVSEALLVRLSCFLNPCSDVTGMHMRGPIQLVKPTKCTVVSLRLPVPPPRTAA
ncbi:D-Tyr-tRNA(Tyr) deacylase [Haematococcus lacustris]|uniref:D-Tyr-tRNA(Tyr) deacylase n=1 Tax=Haematococcus lacustris TaxID=44745 RepID=A0A699ZFH1_HAELA|nr:D-Tyr-tRNA(Tyr) deacylase [Haematococcus lacustris]